MAAVLAIAGAVISPSAANALEGGYDDKYTAYMEPEYFGAAHPETLSQPIVVQDYDKWKTFDGAAIAFCFNEAKSLPPSGELLNEGGHNTDKLPVLTRKQADGNLHRYADSPLNGAIDRPVINIIYNADRVGHHYGLQDWEINMVTQQAIWHFTDSENSGKGEISDFNQAQNAAYITLMGGQVQDGPGLIEAPSNVVLDIYESDQSIISTEGKPYQNLLSTTLRETPDFEEITPSLKTFAHGQTEDDKTIGAEGGTINDVVTYSGLDTSKEYTIEGELMVRGDNGEAESTGITGKTEAFTPEAHLGKKTVEFELTAEQAAKYAGKTLVVFETLKSGGEEVATHHDIKDEDQAMTVEEGETPEASLKTSARDQADDDKVLAAEGGVIVDAVTYEGLTVGQEYTVKGELQERQADGTAKATGIVGEATFTPESESGTVEVEFEVPAGYAGKTLVVFEKVFDAEGNVVASHEDIDDKEQTVTVEDEEETPEASLKTSARDQADDDKVLAAEGGVIVDAVTYEGLTVGQEYTVKGELQERQADGTAKATGIVGEATFTPESESGTVEVEFEVPAGYAGKTLVVFEKVFDAEGNVVASHEDIDDKEQTVTVEDEEKEIPVGSSSGWWAWIIGLIGGGLIGSSVGGSSEGSSYGSSGNSGHNVFSGSSQRDEIPREEVPYKGGETPRDDVGKQSTNNMPEHGERYTPQQAKATTTSGLANTGANVVGVAIAALILIAVGGVLYLRRRIA